MPMADIELCLQEIGKRIMDRRKKLGLTQEALAEKGDVGSLTVVFIFSLTKSLKTLIISMLLSFFIVKFVKIYVLTWANVCYNRHRR